MFDPVATKDSFTIVTEAAPHHRQGRELERQFPELKELSGTNPFSAFFIVLLVGIQIAIAVSIADFKIWQILLVAYLIGAVMNHALFVLVHECAHDLVFQSTLSNRLLGILCNLGQGIPSSMSFRKYHLIHHRSQGRIGEDADLPGFREASWVGRSPWRKALWLSSYSILLAVLRPAILPDIKLFDRWVFINAAIVFAFSGALIWFFGGGSYAYLLLSTFFSVGLHPLGARWIQEHFVVKPGQETYSYYGPLNLVSFNVGYHNEHHDFVRVPWSNLPKVRRVAFAHYDSLYAHPSWPGLLMKFLFDKNLNLFSRIARPKTPEWRG